MSTAKSCDRTLNFDRSRYFSLIFVMVVLSSCNMQQTALEIIQTTIGTIDTIETIYYKQDLQRTDPRNINDTIFRYREMYFERLLSDSIVGVKGHWYMYAGDKEKVVHEDIYNGNRLIRKNNQEKIALIYDLTSIRSLKGNVFGAIIRSMECNMNSNMSLPIRHHTQLKDQMIRLSITNTVFKLR